MKKLTIAVAVLIAAASSAVAVSQAVAHQMPTCFCQPQFGCVCGGAR
ncbi:hypothetical protein [Asticcacaulis sp.]|nr:hypothetical protein [Asticcacaulis sp.]HTM82538.1 hypothetical protein [Asticcacaulis sp.]